MGQESGNDSGEAHPGKQFQTFVVLKTCQEYNPLMLAEAHQNLTVVFIGLCYSMYQAPFLTKHQQSHLVT